MKFFKPFVNVFHFYRNGFREMPSWGRKAWLIIILKGIAVFIIMKLLFFPNHLKKNFDNDEDRSNHVLEQLTKTK